MAEIQSGSLGDFQKQRRNLNKHSARGMAALEVAMRKHGYVAPVTVAADGETIDGSARLETAATVFGGDALVIHHDGRRPLIMVRDDIKSADSPEARAIGLEANRIAELNLTWAADELLADMQAGVDFDGLFDKAEVDALLAGLTMPNGSEWGSGLVGLPTEDKAPFQQMTFTLHDSQAEQVKRAISIASKVGEFTDSPNQNSNGNALALICETFVTEHGQR